MNRLCYLCDNKNLNLKVTLKKLSSEVEVLASMYFDTTHFYLLFSMYFESTNWMVQVSLLLYN